MLDKSTEISNEEEEFNILADVCSQAPGSRLLGKAKGRSYVTWEIDWRIGLKFFVI